MPNSISRASLLDLLDGRRQTDIPAFSGLLHVTAAGLAREGLAWREVHRDAGKMARAAANTFKLTGLPSVTLPLDFTAPAEMLGAELVFYAEDEFQFPQVKRPLVESAREIAKMESGAGRLPIILEAIRLAKEDVGRAAVISGLLPGPYTLLLYLCNPAKLFTEMKKDAQPVIEALFHLSAFLAGIGRAYREAGADFVTVHEMGGSPGFLGPTRYAQFVHPALRELIAGLPAPRVLSVCGDATRSLDLLDETGAEAVSLDQTVDLSAARASLKRTLLFGSLDPVRTLWRGDEAAVREAARRSREAGVDAVWPGCDLVLQTPLENLRALKDSRKERCIIPPLQFSEQE